MLRKALLTTFGAIVAAQNFSFEVVYQFPSPPAAPHVDLENIILRRNGNFVLDLSSGPEIYQFNPRSAKVELLVTVPGAVQSVTGIAEPRPGSDRFVYAAGNVTAASTPPGITGVPNSFSLWTLDLSGPQPVTKQLTAIKEAGLLNGITAVPGINNRALVADSVLGAIWSVDTDTGAYVKFFQDPLLSPTSNFTFGINGIHVKNNFVYFTNSAQVLFGRVPITVDKHNNVAVSGPAQTVAKTTVPNTVFDDFAFDSHGKAWIADPDGGLYTVSSSGALALAATVGNNSSGQRPTSAAFGPDSCTLYVITAGLQTPSGPGASGQILTINTCSK